MYRNRGFSLIGLIITLVVVAIVSGMSLSFSGAFLQDNRLSVANNDLVSAINLARSSAVTRNAKASICASSDGQTCTGTAWELGWIIFTDGDSAGVVDGTDEIVQVHNKAGIDVSITSPSAHIQFKPQGMVASVCVNCMDAINSKRIKFARMLVAAIKNLSPVSSAFASGASGSSGTSGGSGDMTQSCIAPDSEVTGDSGSSGGSSRSGSSSTSSRFELEHYGHYALNLLKQVSPIALAHADGESGSSNISSGGAATCNNGEGTPQQALNDSSFLICDSSRNAEKGNLISVTSVGRVTRSKVKCN